MKPTFALDLTSDSIGLLHRAPKGWLAVGDVAFDAPDLTEALDYLRKTALGLSPIGIATKVVIPNGQILYTEVTAPGPSRDEKRRQIMAGLEGRTPYPVEDLVFDWSGKGATVKVAVVARQTLTEAEAFASEHRFNPVSFVAIPEPGTFVGEPWFGPTAAADTILAPGEAVDRDREAIVLLHRELPRDLPRADAPADRPGPDPVGSAAGTVAEAATPEATGPDDPLPGLEEALSADLPPSDPMPVQDPDPDLAADIIEDLDMDPALVAQDPPARAGTGMPLPEDQAPDLDEAPFAHVTDTGLFPEIGDDLATLPGEQAAAAPDGEDDLPPAPSTAAMVAFASRRAAASTGVEGPAPEPAPRLYGKPVEDLPPLPRAAAPAAALPPPSAPQRNGAAKDLAGFGAAPAVPGGRKSKVKSLSTVPGLPAANPVRPAMPGTKTLTKPGGTFGSKPQHGRPRFLGLILTGLLLLFLALVAAWSSFYLSSADPSVPGTATADATPPGIEDEMLADMQDPDGGTAPLPEAEGAANDTALAAIGDGTVAEPDPAPLAVSAADPAPEGPAAAAPAEEIAAAPVPAPIPVPAPTPVAEPAPDTAVTTDLAPAVPLAEDQDEIFLAAMDTPPPALDALALPPPEARADLLPGAQMPPPVFGTVYQFDANGMLKPTPEGILSPEGVMLIAGKPPLLPPSRTEVASAAASAAFALPATTAAPPAGAVPAATDAVPEPADPTLEGFRPLPRPDGLVPAATAAPADDATLATEAAVRVAALRPLPRPARVLAAAAAARPAVTPGGLGAQAASLTAQNEAVLAAAAEAEAANPSVVAISRRPAARPRDLSRAVEAAVAAAVREPEPLLVASAAPAPDLQPEEQDEADEPEPASAAPRIPTKASVAKQATFVNAINLSKTNLIGVYGTQSKRYALIRQSNGRYKKVRVGDQIDGGRVQAITDSELRYQKGGKLIALKMPKA